MANILLIEDDENLRLTLSRALTKQGHEVSTAATLDDARSIFDESHVDLILSDVNLGEESGIDYIQDVRQSGFVGGIIMMTAFATVDDAVRAMKLGADDYLAKPVRIQELLILTDRVITQRAQTRRLRLYQRIEHTASKSKQPLGSSEPWINAMSLAQRLAQIPVANRSLDTEQSSGGALTTILITGDTGTGKGVAARYIHNSSPEHDHPFVHVNCTALPPSLIESELFGHEKGAFTDAKAAHEGLFEMADGGTIFLDEIGDLDLHLQSKLLSVIEHGRIRKVGSSKERPIRVRVIAATNKDLQALVKQGLFREDLLFRINAFTIPLPNLRNRDQDAVLIASSMLDQLRNEYGLEPAQLTQSAKDAISRHPWPGNVRELFNAIQRAAMLAPTNSITPQDLAIQAENDQSEMNRAEHDQSNPHYGVRFDFDSGIHTAADVERELMTQALEHTNGNVSKAAALIGMQRSSFRYRVERYNIVTSNPRMDRS